ncbi:hypothetical protein D3C71_1849160 [compost metagenome]
MMGLAFEFVARIDVPGQTRGDEVHRHDAGFFAVPVIGDQILDAWIEFCGANLWGEEKYVRAGAHAGYEVN